MATVSNKAVNTGSVTNKDVVSTNTTFADADFTFAEGAGTFGNPYKLTNKAANSGSPSNKARQ